jgi:hypothetical protein
MKKPPLARLPRLIWVTAFLLFIAVWLFPESRRLTRMMGVGLFFVVWFGLIGLCWRWRGARFGLLAVTVLCGGFLLLPARPLPAVDALRRDYIAGLRRYDGVTYFWGGESPKGIDCSGLIRRGLIDAMFLRGLRTFDAGLVRRSIVLWWNDCTAQVLGETLDGATVYLRETPSINVLDHTTVLPGDLAVTTSGLHIMAYLGDHVWIEADPGLGRVVSLTAPVKDNLWFQGPMRLVRWRILAQ